MKLLAIAAALLALAAHAAEPPLPALRADPARTTVSGLSSGGFMAAQYAAIFSSSVSGVGVIAGGPYLCVPSNAGGASACLKGEPSAEASWNAAKEAAAKGWIDPLAALARQRVYLFAGASDRVVRPPTLAAVRDFYRAAGTPAENIVFNDKLPAGHGFVAPSLPGACGSDRPPYLEHCGDHDLPREILRHLLGEPVAPVPAKPSAQVQAFDQRAFGNPGTGLASVGYLYVPAACAGDASSKCSVHIVLHGCGQGAPSMGDAIFEGVGYNRWADAHRAIVLYPQAASTKPLPMNPHGCWDWWGYSGPAFARKEGQQPAALKAMVDKLTGR